MDKDTFHNENTGPDAGAQPPAQPEANEQVAGSDAAPAEQTQDTQNLENTEQPAAGDAEAPAADELPVDEPAEDAAEAPAADELPVDEPAEGEPAEGEQPAEAPVD